MVFPLKLCYNKSITNQCWEAKAACTTERVYTYMAKKADLLAEAAKLNLEVS